MSAKKKKKIKKNIKKKELSTSDKILKFDGIADEKIREARQLLNDAVDALGSSTTYTRIRIEELVADEALRRAADFEEVLRDHHEDYASAANAEDRVIRVVELLEEVF